jgi:hypothetical protein
MDKERLYARIGELTVQFATVEHRLQALLGLLVGRDNELIEPFFIHDLNLFALLRKVRLIARYQLLDDPPLLKDLERAIKRIDTTRDLRNLLVHGQWYIAEDHQACPVRVQDFKMRYDDGQWQPLTETTFTEKKLTQIIARLEGTSQEIERIISKLQARPSTPNASRKRTP